MRIAVITPFYKPSIGGVEYIVYHTAEELVKQGYEVHVVTTNCDNKWRRIARSGITDEEGIIIHRLEPLFMKVGYATMMRELKWVLRKINPDVVHCHNLHPHLFQAIKWRDEMKYKLVAQPHFPVATGIDHLPAKWFYRFAIWDLIREQRKVNIFIAHTNMEKQWLIKEGIEENRIHIVRYPCVPDSLFKYTPKIDIHEKLGSNSVITYISRIHPRKGQHILIETTKYLKDMLEDFKVYLAGPVSDYRYLLSIYKLVERYNVAREIVLEPRALNEVEKFDTMATSDIFACTPLKDNTPVVVLEALALGTIVMITNVGTMQEYKAFIPEGLYLTSMDPIDVANNIVKAMEEGRRCNTLRIAMKVFSCSNIVSQLEKLYKTLVQ